MPSTAFRAEVNGFRFGNHFVNVAARLPRGVKITTNGRCGGMCSAALDYFTLNAETPKRIDLPRDDDPLGIYLLRRQLESFLTSTALRFLWWTVMPDLPDEDLPGVAPLTRDQELPKLTERIDAGATTVLGMVGARRWQDVGRANHQVVAYGYERGSEGGIEIAVYDPNSPGRETVLSVAGEGAGVAADNRKKPWRGFFVHTYVPAIPPLDAEAPTPD